MLKKQTIYKENTGLIIAYQAYKQEFKMKRIQIILFILISFAALQAGALRDLANSMKAGDWRTLATTGIAAALGGTGGSMGNILPYSDDCVWDPSSRKLYFIGSDHQHATGYPRFVVYSESTNTWTTLARPSWFPSLTETAMHGYDHSALNPETGVLYHSPFIKGGGSRRLYSYDTRTSAWLPLIMSPYASACCVGIEYFPEYHGLIFVDNGGARAIYGYKTADKTWSALKTGVSLGDYHQVAEYNPVHKVMIGGGGNGSSALYKIDSLGNVTTMKNAPVTYGINQTVLTVDPAGGDYLMFTNSGQFYAYDVLTDTWALQSGTVPIYTYGGGSSVVCVVAAPVSTYGVTMFVSCNSSSNCWVSLYKRTQGSALEADLQGPGAAPSISLSPNPVARFSAVSISGLRPISCRIFDVHGRLFQSFGFDDRGGTGTRSVFTWDARGLPSGLYLMEVTDGAKRLARRVLVQR